MTIPVTSPPEYVTRTEFDMAIGTLARIMGARFHRITNKEGQQKTFVIPDAEKNLPTLLMKVSNQMVRQAEATRELAALLGLDWDPEIGFYESEEAEGSEPVDAPNGDVPNVNDVVDVEVITTPLKKKESE